MNTNGHYDVTRWKDGARGGEVQAIVCNYCQWFTKPAFFPQGRSRSGLGRYNRARAAMVKHLHAEHRDALAWIEDKAGSRRKGIA